MRAMVSMSTTFAVCGSNEVLTPSSEPHASGGCSPVPQCPVHGVDEGLAAGLEAGAAALLVHRVAEGHTGARVGEAEGPTRAQMTERLLGEDHAVVLAGR